MNRENTNEFDNNYEEISLKEIISVLLNGKKLIAIITIVVVALAGFYSFFIQYTEYENDSLINVSIKDTVETPYGEFETPYRTLDEYTRIVKNSEVLKMTAKDMNNTYSEKRIASMINTEAITADRSFRINVKSDKLEETYQIAQAHTDNYIQYLQFDLTKKAINYLYNKSNSDINVMEKKLEKNSEDMARAKEVLKNTPKTIDLENALLTQTDYSQFVSPNGEFDSQEFKGQRIVSQEVHPSYEMITNRLTELEMERNDLLNYITVAKINMEELTKDKQSMEDFQEIPSPDDINIGISQAMKNLVVVSQRPQLESREITPGYKLNIAIAIVLGLMMGVFVAFFRDYWKKN